MDRWYVQNYEINYRYNWRLLKDGKMIRKTNKGLIGEENWREEKREKGSEVKREKWSEVKRREGGNGHIHIQNLEIILYNIEVEARMTLDHNTVLTVESQWFLWEKCTSDWRIWWNEYFVLFGSELQNSRLKYSFYLKNGNRLSDE